MGHELEVVRSTTDYPTVNRSVINIELVVEADEDAIHNAHIRIAAYLLPMPRMLMNTLSEVIPPVRFSRFFSWTLLLPVTLITTESVAQPVIVNAPPLRKLLAVAVNT